MDLRNIAIIAHVDHGKTTLVDHLLKQSGTFQAHQQVAERAMDSNDLERERGITILAKCTSVVWNDKRLNIVDTPGHADFGGEVERILTMVDGVVLLVDAAEGVMPQTKFVLGKALGLGLHPIVLINKVDRQDARIEEVVDEIVELFLILDAKEHQLDFPILYASGRAGWCTTELDKVPTHLKEGGSLEDLFKTIVSHVPKPKVDVEAPFQMLLTTREYDSFLGRILTGKVQSGRLKLNQSLKVLNRNHELVEQGRVSKILAFRGLDRVPAEEAEAGDIIAIAGFEKANVADTLTHTEATEALPAQPIDPPTLSMTFSVNDSPLSGREGTHVTSRLIRDRLFKEAESNVALRVTESESKDSFEVAGRGELQLGVLIETMRREGFELSISRPRVLFKTNEQGQKEEPYEEIMVDVDDEFVGTVVESLSLRKSEMQDMKPSGGGKTRITFVGPSRGLIGYHSLFLTETRGTGIMNRVFHSYGPYKGAMDGRRNGVLLSTEKGDAVGYALWNLEDRGTMFVSPGTPVYTGMIIGENSREQDLEVNPLKAKQLSNVRASGKDDAIRLTPPRVMTVEQAIAYIEDDECVEVTPKSVRLRKTILCPHDRKKQSRK